MSATVTAYDTTLPLVLAGVAVGAIAVTVPVTLRVDRADRDGRGLADAIDGEVALDDVGRDLERRRRR